METTITLTESSWMVDGTDLNAHLQTKSQTYTSIILDLSSFTPTTFYNIQIPNNASDFKIIGKGTGVSSAFNARITTIAGRTDGLNFVIEELSLEIPLGETEALAQGAVIDIAGTYNGNLSYIDSNSVITNISGYSAIRIESGGNLTITGEPTATLRTRGGDSGAGIGGGYDGDGGNITIDEGRVISTGGYTAAGIGGGTSGNGGTISIYGFQI